MTLLGWARVSWLICARMAAQTKTIRSPTMVKALALLGLKLNGLTLESQRQSINMNKKLLLNALESKLRLRHRLKPRQRLSEIDWRPRKLNAN